jgi:hypothetical protein
MVRRSDGCCAASRVGLTTSCSTPKDQGASAPRGTVVRVTFREHGRAFYVFYGFGRKAPKLVRARAVALLDGLRISRRR